MSIFGDNMKNTAEWKEKQQKEVYFGLFILGPHVLFAGVTDPDGFVSSIEDIICNNNLHVSPIAENNIGRPIKIINCSTLAKGDALGELFSISKKDIEKRRIIIIENIDDIPKEDSTHDNPKYVESLLLHGWKEDIRSFSDSNLGNFSLKTKNYTILIPFNITKKEAVLKIWHKYDGFAWIEDFDMDLKDWKKTGFDDAYGFLLKAGHIISLDDLED